VGGESFIGVGLGPVGRREEEEVSYKLHMAFRPPRPMKRV
jgi:hypothetical protein